MKKSFLYLFTVLCTLSFFTACSDDDDPKDPNVLDVNATYSGEKLELKYSNEVLPGKEVSFDTKDGKTATITMKGTFDMSAIAGLFRNTKASEVISLVPGVIPGEKSTTLSNVVLTLAGEKYTFEGTDEANGRTVKYVGEVTKDKMTLSLDVAMPDNALTGTWNLAPIVPGGIGEANKSQPVYSLWESSVPFSIDPFGMGTPMELQPGAVLVLAMAMPMVGDMNAQQLFLNVLQNVTFNKDGNITASYSKGSDIKDPQWKNSPLNMVQYTVKDGKILLFLNPDMVLGNITKNATKAGLADMDIEKIIGDFLPMLSGGFPLAYEQSEGNLKVYADTEFVLKVFNVVLPLLQNEEILAKIKAAITKDPAFAQYAPMVEAMLAQLPAVVKGTTKIELGINLTK